MYVDMVLAVRRGLCAEYDSICEELGIPGRVRSFTVKVSRNGIDLSAKVKARSQKEADELVLSSLGGDE